VKPLRSYFDYHDPKVRGRLLRFFWIVSLFMLVLGYLLIAYFLFFR
jgi:phage shock protein PspC (stress-responsive transcriptional regulator)